MADGGKMKFRQAMRLHLRAFREIQRLTPGAFWPMAAQTAFSALTPYGMIYLSARLLDELSGPARPDALRGWAMAAVAAGLLIGIGNSLLRRWGSCTRFQFNLCHERLFVEKMFSLDFADAEDPKVRDLKFRIATNANWFDGGLPKLFDMMADLLSALIGILGALALTVSLFTLPVPPDAAGWKGLQSFWCAAGMALLILLVNFLSGHLQGRAAQLEVDMAAQAKHGNLIFGYFGFFGCDERDADLRMYSQQNVIRRYFQRDVTAVYGSKGLIARLSRGKIGLYPGLAAGLTTLVTGAVYMFACLKGLAGAFGVGAITQYVGAVTALSASLVKLFTKMGEIRANGHYLTDVFSFLDIPNAMYQGTLTTEKRNDREYQIEFRDVSFRYPGAEQWALRHVNAKFRVGSRIAIVGENGSGKTTFIKLLCRLYDPQEGEILLNGIDIRKYDYRQYMDIFSVVFQDFQLLSQPLGDNVAGSKAYDRERVTKALNDAGFGERLKTMPQGLSTLLYRQFDEGGLDISGGEAQKIAIARALYRNAPFLILDEPTAALDPIAEAEIYAQLNQIVGDRTAVYISHRLSSCRFCDEIWVFDHGQIIQTGTHEALVSQRSGKYFALWNAQAQYYAEKS